MSASSSAAPEGMAAHRRPALATLITAAGAAGMAVAALAAIRPDGPAACRPGPPPIDVPGAARDAGAERAEPGIRWTVRDEPDRFGLGVAPGPSADGPCRAAESPP